MPAGAADQAPPRRTAALEAALREHGFAIACIVLAVLLGYAGALVLPAVDIDNVATLSFVDRGNPLDFFTGPVVWAHSGIWRPLPAFRPAAYLSVWAQTQVTGLRFLPLYAFNLAALVGCAVALYALVVRLTGSRIAGALAGAALGLDERGFQLIVWVIERQNSLAALFGLGALLLVLGAKAFERRALGWLFALLLLSVLSKEYGLAYCIAVPALAFAQRPGTTRRVTAVAGGVVATYAVLRFAIAGVTSGTYCESLGYFHTTRDSVCYASLSTGQQLAQHAYNMGATLVGIVEPGFFDPNGMLQTPSPHGLLVPTIVAMLAAVGAILRPRAALPLLTLVVANAALSFMVYRPRDQFVGMTGLYAAAGVGAGVLLTRVEARDRLRVVAAVCVVVASGWIMWHGTKLQTGPFAAYLHRMNNVDPCGWYRGGKGVLHLDVVAEIKVRMGEPDPTCRR